LLAGLAATAAPTSKRWNGPTLNPTQLVPNFLGGDSGPTVLTAYNPAPQDGPLTLDVTKTPLLLVPGRFQNLDEYQVMVKHFSSEGRQIFFLLYDSARRDPVLMAQEMGAELTKLKSFYGRTLPLDVVAHSQGGLEMRLALGQLQSTPQATPNSGFGRVRLVALDSPWSGVTNIGFSERLLGGANIESLKPDSPFLTQVRKAQPEQMQLRTFETLEDDGYVRGLVDLPDAVVKGAAEHLLSGAAGKVDPSIENVVAWLGRDDRSPALRERLAVRLKHPTYSALLDLSAGVLRNERTPGENSRIVLWQVQPERARSFAAVRPALADLPPEGAERVARALMSKDSAASPLAPDEQAVRDGLDQAIRDLGFGALSACRKQMQKMLDAGAAHTLRSVALELGMLSATDHRGILKDTAVLEQASKLFAEP